MQFDGTKFEIQSLWYIFYKRIHTYDSVTHTILYLDIFIFVYTNNK